MKKLIQLLIICFVFVGTTKAQFDPEKSSVSGNFKLDAQTYNPDAAIGADTVAEKLLSNSYMNIIYNYGNFTAGLRFEGYLNTMLGYDEEYNGFGIGNRYATYAGELLEVTAGNFYEQFGNGLTFRAYEDRDLGYDNAMDGARIKVKPAKGVILTGIIGQQRLYWEKSAGIVRGIDGDFELNQIISGLASSNNIITIGGSYVSKYQADQSPLFIFPENVATGAGRLNYSFKGFNLATEYAYKSQDPSFDNRYVYKPGSALLLNGNYSKKGIGVMMQYKWVDNMSFRSDRNETINNVLINSMPAISKNHTYAYAAMYPYATQLNGEAGIQAEFFYKFKKKSVLGGKYGTLLAINASRVVDIDKQALNDSTKISTPGTDGYTTSFLSMTDSVFFQDLNVEITKKFSKKFKGVFTYQYITYNQKALQGHLGMVNANTFIADVTWKIKPKHSLRVEAQALFTKLEDYLPKDSTESISIKQDYGDWALLTLEYSISPHWFFAISDQFNFVSGDDEIAQNTLLYNHETTEFTRNHYVNVAMGYTKGASRIALSYGKQREGILCVGGVCRAVPAANGFLVTVSHTF